MRRTLWNIGCSNAYCENIYVLFKKSWKGNIAQRNEFDNYYCWEKQLEIQLQKNGEEEKK